MNHSLATAFVATCAMMPTLGGAAVVTEFYNTPLDNYFITADPNEQAAIDGGSAGPGWARTGKTFLSGGNEAVCRFYGSQSPGPNSHFYTISPSECQSLKDIQATTPADQKRWNFESLDFLSSAPINGVCPVGTTFPVYRAYNNGFARNVDSNHRITTSAAGIQQVVVKGWVSEGVVMCAPSPVPTTGARLDCYRPYSTLSTEYVKFSFSATAHAGFAIAKLFLNVKLLILGAPVPLISAADFTYEIPGGMADGATKQFDLQPNIFSDFATKTKPFCHDGRRVLELKITGVADGNGVRHDFVE